MIISVKIPQSQITKAISAFSKYSKGAASRVMAAKAITAINVQREAAKLSPVDTGRLRSSIVIEGDPSGSDGDKLVGTNVEYAIHQEFGTRYQKGKPFLFPAAESERSAHRKRMIEALRP